MSIGERIAEERKRLGITQASFADKLGVSLSSQKRYETNDRSPDIDYVGALVEVGADVAYIMTGTRTPQDRLRFFSKFDRDAAELLALSALHLDIDGFADAVSEISAAEDSPQFWRDVVYALIQNSPTLQEVIKDRVGKATAAKKRGK